jgi:23S rRNA (cytosine1962-C5)-methyltransferase
MTETSEASAPEEPLDRGLRQRAFPWLDPRWIVYEDRALIAIDKPEGVPTQEARASAKDDLPTRLTQFLEERGEVSPYVGVHQRLDKETSGIIVYTRSRDANPSIGKQFEERRIEKKYLAVVSAGPRHTFGRLEHRLKKGPDGTSVVVPRSDPQGKTAITHVRIKQRGKGERTLVEARIETGRMHQIRAQLAHSGAPIVGDALYGGAPATRMMLHASELTLVHPKDNRELTLRAERPFEFDAWLEGRDDVLADPARRQRALACALSRRFALGRAGLEEKEVRTTAFRWVNAEGDGVPGVAVDIYADWVLLHLYGEHAESHEGRLADVLSTFGFAGIYVKRRPRQSNMLKDDTTAFAPATPIRGEPAPDEFLIRENGIGFLVRLGDGMSTGLFLDQRANRERVRAIARERSVLNLFSYTCGFGVAAAVGGATRTVNVDSSGSALDRGRRNLAIAGHDNERHATVRADVFEWLERAARRGERFDLVCCDPPTYSTSKSGRWTSGKKWRELAAACFRVLAPHGVLMATSNDQRMSQAWFRDEIRRGATLAEAHLESLRDLPPAMDFPSAPGSEPHLKALVATRS